LSRRSLDGERTRTKLIKIKWIDSDLIYKLSNLNLSNTTPARTINFFKKTIGVGLHAVELIIPPASVTENVHKEKGSDEFEFNFNTDTWVKVINYWYLC